MPTTPLAPVIPNHTPDRIEKQIDINAPVARVWRALTDHTEFGAWFRWIVESPFVVGKTVRGRITKPGYEHVVVELVVRAIEPQTYFAYNWHPYCVDMTVDYSKETPTLVEFRLEPLENDARTRLRVTESGFDKIPASRREEAFRKNTGGWEIQLQNIERYATSH